MADILNLKINERANVERPNLRESLEYKMKLILKGNMKIRKIANGAEYRIDEHFKNFLILGILIIFQITKKIYIRKVCNLQNSQNFYGKLAIFQIAIID